MFGGGGSRPPDPVVPAPPPERTDVEIQQARAEGRQRLRNRRGRASTALTPTGAPREETSADYTGGQTELLGGARATRV